MTPIICAGPGCEVVIERPRWNQRFHDPSCRLTAWLADHPKTYLIGQCPRCGGALRLRLEDWTAAQVWRAAVLARDPICVSCGQAPSAEADHIVPFSHGGSGSLANGQGLCKPCHSRKTKLEARLTPGAIPLGVITTKDDGERACRVPGCRDDF